MTSSTADEPTPYRVWGSAEPAWTWPPAWVAYLAGSLRTAGYTDIRFVDAMTNRLSEVATAPSNSATTRSSPGW